MIFKPREQSYEKNTRDGENAKQRRHEHGNTSLAEEKPKHSCRSHGVAPASRGCVYCVYHHDRGPATNERRSAGLSVAGMRLYDSTIICNHLNTTMTISRNLVSQTRKPIGCWLCVGQLADGSAWHDRIQNIYDNDPETKYTKPVMLLSDHNP